MKIVAIWTILLPFAFNLLAQKTYPSFGKKDLSKKFKFSLKDQEQCRPSYKKVRGRMLFYDSRGRARSAHNNQFRFSKPKGFPKSYIDPHIQYHFVSVGAYSDMEAIAEEIEVLQGNDRTLSRCVHMYTAVQGKKIGAYLINADSGKTVAGEEYYEDYYFIFRKEIYGPRATPKYFGHGEGDFEIIKSQ